MRQKVPTLAVPDIARIKGETPEEAADWLVEYLNAGGGVFNYVRATRSIRVAYRGFHNIEQLAAGCAAEKTDLGRKCNQELVRAVAPLAFGRTLQVFDLPPRKFAFGHRQSGFRIPFFFLENKTVKLYAVWPRKRSPLSLKEIGMIATIYKNYLLDTEFFGLPADIEFVETSAPIGSKDRCVESFCLADLELWSEADLSDRLTIISRAFDLVENRDDIRPRRRTEKQIAPDMPLFD